MLVFILGSGIAFLLGLEFIGLLFLLVYAGAIAVLVLFVVMMLDIKAIENPWSKKEKRLAYFGGFILFVCTISAIWYKDFQDLIRFLGAIRVGSESFDFMFYGRPESYLDLIGKRVASLSNKDKLWLDFCDSEGLTEFLQLFSYKKYVDNSYLINNMWFVDFDTSCSLNDPSYLLYSTYAILLIIAGIVLLIAMIGAITLTLQKNCPESLYRQLGRESKNAVFSIKEKKSFYVFGSNGLKESS